MEGYRYRLDIVIFFIDMDLTSGTSSIERLFEDNRRRKVVKSVHLMALLMSFIAKSP